MLRPLRCVTAPLVLALLAPLSYSQTQVAGSVSGVWDVAGSPYLLVGQVQVTEGATLEIEPGVEVIGKGYFRMDVRPNGRIIAVGTADRPILFTATDQVTGWRGLRLDQALDDSHVRHCIFEYAHGRGAFDEVRGGALYVLGCSPLVEDCEMRFCTSQSPARNGGGAGIMIESSNGTFLRNHVHHNISDSGGGICVAEYGSPLIADCLITDNSAANGGGGMYFGARSSPIVERNRILRNHAEINGGGGVNSWTIAALYGTSATLRNNVIAFNTSTTTGGGAYMRYDRCSSQNDLYAFNSAPQGSGIWVINQGGSPPNIRGAIVWGNAGSSIELDSVTGSSVIVRESLVQGGWTGAGNVDTDPLFLDPVGADGIARTDDADFRLRANSPAIDASTATPPFSGVDANGEPRDVDDPCVVDSGLGSPGFRDLGPFERQSSSCCSDPMNVCTTTANSAGSGALSGWRGSVSISSNNFVLEARGVPANRVGIWLYAFQPANPPTPLSGGLLCLAGPIVRLGPPVTADAAGRVTRPLDFGAPPLLPGTSTGVAPGATTWFQLWFRDGGSGGAAADTSDALQVTFCN